VWSLEREEQGIRKKNQGAGGTREGEVSRVKRLESRDKEV
jgi:hypothetical protein